MPPESTSKTQSPWIIRRRRVFYFSGFDPRGPGHYHTLYKTESEIQKSINGLELEISKRRRVGSLANAWTIQLANEETETDYQFLRWDDIIRQHWPKNELELLKSALPVYWVFLKANLIGRLLKIAWPSALTVSYPVIAFLGVLWIALLMMAAWLAVPALTGFPWWAGLVPAALTGVGAVALTRWLDQRFRSYWLLRTYSVMQPWAYGKIPALDERIREFATHIVSQIKDDDVEEVVLVGHSVGTILTIPLIVELLKLKPDLGVNGPSFGLVSLGNCIPLVSLLPGSKKLREDLLTVATAPGIHWFDFSARRDGASVTQVDPLAVSGIPRPAGIPVRPLQFPVRIVKMFPPEVYDVVKKDIFRIHFQYLMAAQLPTDYDFFAITAGSIPLTVRYVDTPTPPLS